MKTLPEVLHFWKSRVSSVRNCKRNSGHHWLRAPLKRSRPLPVHPSSPRPVATTGRAVPLLREQAPRAGNSRVSPRRGRRTRGPSRGRPSRKMRSEPPGPATAPALLRSPPRPHRWVQRCSLPSPTAGMRRGDGPGAPRSLAGPTPAQQPAPGTPQAASDPPAPRGWGRGWAGLPDLLALQQHHPAPPGRKRRAHAPAGARAPQREAEPRRRPRP